MALGAVVETQKHVSQWKMWRWRLLKNGEASCSVSRPPLFAPSGGPLTKLTVVLQHQLFSWKQFSPVWRLCDSVTPQKRSETVLQKHIAVYEYCPHQSRYTDYLESNINGPSEKAVLSASDCIARGNLFICIFKCICLLLFVFYTIKLLHNVIVVVALAPLPQHHPLACKN